MKTTKSIPTIKVLGVRVDMVQMPQVMEAMERWIKERERCHYIVVSGMHGVMEARRRAEFKTVVNEADLSVPDGFSLVWVGRRRGFNLEARVSGADLMSEFIRHSEGAGYSNFFYGDTQDTLDRLTTRMKREFPALQVAGAHSPPFRPLTPQEDDDQVEMINASKADVVWIGLGLPKQERWMFEHRHRLNAPVIVGVGAAFKIWSGQVRRAPPWIGNHGLEWLWRFGQEPKRLWRRVLIDVPRFTGCVALELSGLKKYH